MKKLWKMFWIFFRIGAFTFGGGFAMIPLIEKEIVDKQGWVDEEEIIDVFALAQSVPGAIGINASTFVGYKVAGFSGAIIATLGMVIPSFITITLIASVFTKFQDALIVQAALKGIRATVVALIGIAAVKMGKAAIKDRISLAIAIVGLILLLVFNVQAIYIIMISALMGLAFFYLSRKEGNSEE